MSNFTPEQARAAELRGASLIVSAGAGAGKTRTLIERVFLQVTRHHGSLERLLLVTFTRAAAAQMKERLAEKLRDEIALSDDAAFKAHLQHQLFLLPRARISTIHSFLLDLISAHAPILGIPPGLELLSEEEERLDQRDFLEARIEELLEENGPQTKVLRTILDFFPISSCVSQLVQSIIRLHHFLSSQPRPEDAVLKTREFHSEDGSWRHLLDRERLDALRSMAAKLDEILCYDPAALYIKYRDQYQHAAMLKDLIERSIASEVDADLLIPRIVESSFPKLSSPKPELAMATDLAFRITRDNANKAIKREQKSLESLHEPDIITHLDDSAAVLELFVGTTGVSWLSEFQDECIARRRMTMSHVEQLAHRLLVDAQGQPTTVARLVAETFDEVMVDEVQDINKTQQQILSALARKEPGNLFLVGDIKQSIYEFRQSDPSIFLSIYENAKKDGVLWHSLDLLANFRSEPELLGEFNGFFDKVLLKDTVDFDYSSNHRFIAGRESSGPACMSLHVLAPEDPDDIDEESPIEEIEDSAKAEARYVANLIKAIGPPWRHIAILLRAARATVPVVMRALEREGIPAFSTGRLGFLTSAEVIEAQALLTAIENPCNDLALLGTLRGPAFRWSEDDMLRLRLLSPHLNFIDLLETASQSDFDQAELQELRMKSTRVITALRHWQEASTRMSMADFFTLLFEETHLLEQAAVRPSGDQRRLNLLYLADRAKLFDSFQRKGLSQFLRFLEDLIRNQEDFGSPVVLAPDADMVSVMTIHAAKGLEFEHVIIPYAGRQRMAESQPFIMHRDFGVASRILDSGIREENPPPLYDLLRGHTKRQATAEDLRLLYVALTRAERCVHIVGTLKEREHLSERWETYRRLLDDPVSIYEAKCALDWYLGWAAARFEVPTMALERGGTISSGIAHFNIFPENPRPSLRTGEEDFVPPSTEVIAGIRDAQRRIAQADSQIGQLDIIRAKVSVSEVKRAWDALRDRETPPFRPRSDAKFASADLDWLPESLHPKMKPESSPDARLAGVLTHRFLAEADLTPVQYDATFSLSGEAQRLVAKGIFKPHEVPLIDLKGIQWFLQEDLGQRWLWEAQTLKRERAFTIRVSPAELGLRSEDSTVILQGIVDVLFKEKGSGWTLMDFKTDYCGKNLEQLDDLVESYTPQIQLYRLLVEQTLGEPVSEAYLVFLKGREIVPIPATTNLAETWQRIVEAGVLIAPEDEEL